MFSKACEYGIKATIFVVKQSMEGKRSNLNGISEGIGSPVAFTAKILQQLVKSKIIFSTKGANGGFEIEKKNIKSLNLLKVIIAIDGDGLFNSCVLGLRKCSNVNPCPMHQKYTILRNNLVHVFDTTLIQELANSLNVKEGVLKN